MTQLEDLEYKLKLTEDRIAEVKFCVKNYPGYDRAYSISFGSLVKRKIKLESDIIFHKLYLTRKETQTNGL